MERASERDEIPWVRLGLFWLGLFVVLVLLELVVSRSVFRFLCVVALMIVIASLLYISTRQWRRRSRR